MRYEHKKEIKEFQKEILERDNTIDELTQQFQVTLKLWINNYIALQQKCIMANAWPPSKCILRLWL
jgi:hemerythrin